MSRKSRVTLLAPVPRFKVVDLEPELRDPFIRKDEEVNEAMQAFGKAGIRLGKKLFEMQHLLKAERRFVTWLNSKMPPKTGYRILSAYKRLSSKYSPAIIERMIAADVPAFGVTNRSPYGKFTHIIENNLIGPPPKDDDPAKIDAWILQLREKQKEIGRVTKPGNWLDTIAEALARAYLRDPKAKDFREWLAKVQAAAAERIKQKEQEKENP